MEVPLLSLVLWPAMVRWFDWMVCWWDLGTFVGFLARCLVTAALAGCWDSLVSLLEIRSSLFHITDREIAVAVVQLLQWTVVWVVMLVWAVYFAWVSLARHKIDTPVQETVVANRFDRLAAVADKSLSRETDVEIQTGKIVAARTDLSCSYRKHIQAAARKLLLLVCRVLWLLGYRLL